MPNPAPKSSWARNAKARPLAWPPSWNSLAGIMTVVRKLVDKPLEEGLRHPLLRNPVLIKDARGTEKVLVGRRQLMRVPDEYPPLRT